MWQILHWKAGVTKHFKQVHLGLRTWDEYTFDQCGQVFGSNIRLERQIEIKHTEANFPCETCSKECKSNADLRYHMKKQHSSNTVPPLKIQRSWRSHLKNLSHRYCQRNRYIKFMKPLWPRQRELGVDIRIMTYSYKNKSCNPKFCANIKHNLKPSNPDRMILDVFLMGHAIFRCIWRNLLFF